MAAAYASLLSLMHTIEQIQHHPHPPISIDTKQCESLTENITFLQNFLEGYSCGGNEEAAASLERRIADAAYAAEDIIESQIVDLIRAQRSTFCKKIIGCFQFFLILCNSDEYKANKLYQGLGKVIEDMEFLKIETMKIEEKMEVQCQQQRISSSRSRPTTGKKNIMVSFDDVLIEILDKLTGEHDCQIIPVVGMGGVGKTTLAQHMYVNPLVKQYFDIRVWATISQEYSMREILSEIVGQVNMVTFPEMTDEEIGEKLYKHLWGRRYLIVMDDMWSVDAWEKIKRFFPKDNGSRIVVTTRLANLASLLTNSSYSLEMKLLDEVKSWNLFCKTVFEEESGCPWELEDIGKEIAKNCRGLPLSIVVIGGLLAKSNHTREYWEYIAENLNSILNMEDDERCLKILYMSYNELPIHLKPCFLYMGVYPEDHAIRVSELIKLWVAEGFVRPSSSNCLEEVAKECLKDLVDRNLIIVHELGSTGNIKRCKIHDLLRDLCFREAHKDRFYYVTRKPHVKVPKGMRRHVIPEIIPLDNVLARSLQSSTAVIRTFIWRATRSIPSFDFKLLRIFKAVDQGTGFNNGFHDLENLLMFVNLRDSIVPPPVDIWKMPQLRHVKVEPLYLPADDEQEDMVVLCNLQTLGRLRNFNSNEAVKRIPNIKKLKTNLRFEYANHLDGFDRLQKLESLSCRVHLHDTGYLQSFNFPHSLKKLTLKADYLQQEDIMDKIGLLPFLEKFKGSFRTHTWETVEGQFRSLKFLEISNADLESWKTESTHFPRLEHLGLFHLKKLKEIPSDIGEIATLRSIKLEYCSDSAIISAKEILERQQDELGEVGLQIRVRLGKMFGALGSLASDNFQIE